MKTNRKNKILAMALTLAMVLTLIPAFSVTVSAAASFTLDKQIYKPAHVMTFNFAGVTGQMSLDQATVVINNEKGEWTGSYFRTTGKTGSFSMTMNAPGAEGKYEAVYYASLNGNAQNLVQKITFTVSYAPTAEEAANVKVTMDKSVYKPSHVMTFNFVGVTPEMSNDQATVTIMNEKGEWTGAYIRTSGKVGSFSMTMNAPGEGNYEAQYYVSSTSNATTKGANLVYTVPFSVSYAPTLQEWQTVRVSLNKTAYKPGEIMTFNFTNVTSEMSFDQATVSILNEKGVWTGAYFRTTGKTGSFSMTMNAPSSEGQYEAGYYVSLTDVKGKNHLMSVFFVVNKDGVGSPTKTTSMAPQPKDNASGAGTGVTVTQPENTGGTGTTTTPPAATTTTTAKGHVYDASTLTGGEVIIFDNWNTGGVSSNPTAATTFTTSQSYTLTFIDTYHYNNNGTLAGTISLKDQNGITYGPWQTQGIGGQGGVANASWEYHFPTSVTIPAGTYTIIDSNPSTWSRNSSSGGSGFAQVRGIPAGGTSAPATTGDTTVTFGTGTYTGGNPVGIDEGISVGPSFSWTAQSGVLGYRIYRSRNSGVQGLSVTDFYIENTEFIDVNVDSNTTYYYTIRAVLAEADPWNDVEEKLGSPSSEIKITTEGEILGGDASKVGQKHFISMVVDKPNMTVDEKVQEIDPGRGTVPLNLDGRVRVPISKIIEAMGGKASYEDSTRTVTLTRGDIKVDMVIGKKGMLVNGVEAEMDVAPELVNGRTMIAIRFAATSTGAKIDFINSKKQVVVVYVG
ncbi:hypothetical protein FACS1894219_04290 [Clostridia bacterium]|nr:hypothetical protein FACS1894219_04290 [Clostridia bacterium]